MPSGRKGICRSRVVVRPFPRLAPGLRAGALAAALLAGSALAPAAARAAEPVVTFSIPAEPLDDALVAFGKQAGLSVGLRDPARCDRTARAVVGRYTPSEALGRLLAGNRCGFEVLDAHAFTVGPRPPAVAAATAGPPPAPPRPPESEASSDLLLDLTVTTTRRPSLVSQTPASISVVSANLLTAGHLESLDELAPEFAGVTVTNLGPGLDKVLVRGLSDGAFTGRTQSTVGLYLDDVPITYNGPDPDLRLVDIDRVELMRGPQGPLYGVGAMGGIVHIVAKKPDLDHIGVGVDAGAAATWFGAPSYSADAMLNAPLVSGRLGLRAVAYTETQGGYIDDVDLKIDNANTTRRTGGRAQLTSLIGSGWELNLGGTRQSLRSDDAQYIQGDADGTLQRQGKVREPHDSDFTQLSASLDGPTPLGRLRLTTALIDHNFDDTSDASNGLALFVSNSKIGSFEQDYRIRLETAEAVLTSYPGTKLQWLAGVFASRTREAMYLDLSDVGGVAVLPLYQEDRHDRMGEVDVYGEFSYALTRKLTFTVGARGFHTWLSTDSVRHQQFIPLSFDGSMESAHVSPKAVLSWQTSPASLFYVQAAEGYRNGGFNTTGRINQQFNAGATGNQPNRQYHPDTVLSAEAGTKLALDDHRWELRASVFYTDWRDVQSDQFLPSGLPYTANVGRATNLGVEAEAAFRASRTLTLRLNGLAAGPELIDRDPTYPARPNASLPAVPRYSASLIGDWRREVRPGLAAVLYGRVSYVGASIVTFQDQPSSSMGNYVTARLAAGVETGAWRFTAYCDNPTNTIGDTFAFGDPFTQGRVSQSTPLRPRTVGVTLSRGL